MKVCLSLHSDAEESRTISFGGGFLCVLLA